jgi:type IV secretory pathway VirB2 component (pilin)
MSAKIEAILAVVTMGVTLITGDIIIDFIVGISVYFASRLLYRNFGNKLNTFLNKIFKK